MPALVSLIILNYNASRFVDRLVSSLLKQTYRPLEVIVFDNNSSDDSAPKYQKLESSFDKFLLIRHDQNAGFARANNLAMQRARGKYLFFLNCDLWLAPDAVELLVARAEQSAPNSILAPRQRTYDDRQDLNCGLGLDIFGFPVPLTPGVPLFYADGAALFLERTLFSKLGQFDEDTFFTSEDVGLSWRARLAGHQILPVPEAKVYHWSGGILSGGAARTTEYITSAKRRFYTEKNILRNLLIHYQFSTRLWLMPLYFFWQAGECLGSLILLGWAAAAVYPRSWAWNWRQRRSILVWRQKVAQLRQINDRDLMKYMVWRNSKLQRLRQVGRPRLKSS